MRSILKLSLCFSVPMLLTSCYVLRQALPFLTHRIGARSVEKILDDDDVDTALKGFLETVEDIRSFAITELGLADTDNYTRYYQIENDYLAAVIQAAEEFSIEPYLFTYPVLGPLPYRGFYNPDHARKEAEKLKEKGLEVFVRPVDAFSSLGYFRDPLYSFMVDYSPARLADLIIHEQTHATVFVKGESGFNEKLATVVGREGALRYVAAQYGEDSREYEEVIQGRRDSVRFSADMHKLGLKLTEVYNLDISIEEKRRRKSETLASFKREFAENYEERYESERYRRVTDMELNNAYLSLFRLYEEPDGRLQKLLEQTGRIAEMITLLKAEIESGDGSPWEAVDKLLAS